MLFVTGHGDRCAAHRFGFLDLDVPISKGDQAGPGRIPIAEQVIDHSPLGENFIASIAWSMDATLKIVIDLKCTRFGEHTVKYCPTGKMEGKPGFPQGVEECASTGDHQIVRSAGSGCHGCDARMNHIGKSLLIVGFVSLSGLGMASPIAYQFSESRCLVNTWLSIQSPDLGPYSRSQRFSSFTFHQGQVSQPLVSHDDGPAGPDQGEGAIEIEKNMLKVPF